VRDQGFHLFFVDRSDGGFMGDLGQRMTDFDDRRRLSDRLILDDFHAVHMATRTFGAAFGNADDFRPGFALQGNAAFDHAAGKLTIKADLFVDFDQVIVMSEYAGNKLDDRVIVGLYRFIQIESADPARRQ